MKILKTFNQFINENVNQSKPKYDSYCFDWDDNILHMETLIHMDHLEDGKWIPTDVSTAEFAKIRSDKENWRIIDNNPDKAFSEFRDDGPRGIDAFLLDVKKTISNKDFGPAWDAFIKCLVNGNIFSIITARGHSSAAMKKGVEYIIFNILSTEQKNEMAANLTAFVELFDHVNPVDNKLTFKELVKIYLDSCDFCGVSSPEFNKKYGTDPTNPELGKEIAIKKFNDKINAWGKEINANVSLGFSDDDLKNFEHIKKVFSDELSLKYPTQYYVYNTNDRKIKGGVKTKIDYKKVS